MERTPLHPIERKVLAALRGSGWVDLDSLAKSSVLLKDQVRRAISWLSSKGLISVRTESRVRISPTYDKPPELVLLDMLRENNGSSSLADLRQHFKTDSEFNAAVGRANSKKWVSMSLTNNQQSMALVVRETDVEKLLLLITAGDLKPDSIPPELKPAYDDLLRRQLIKLDEKESTSVAITESGESALAAGQDESYVEKLTPETISSARSSTQIRLRPIDVTAPAPHFFPGRRHPVREFINEVREVYLSMGFSEIIGDSIQSAFWNFDALFQPQDHPARDLQDTFYIKDGLDRAIERKGLVARVGSTHEDGWKTGSRGWRYSWNIQEARRLVLRTHNTVLTVQATARSGNAETRVFSVGRVYRNESLDYKHLAELHQMEGIIIGEGLSIRHLKGVLSKFYSRLGMSGVKLWPSFFPYTEPSMQVMTYSERAGKWFEMGGSGIFRPEVTLPLGVTNPVLAWGCGLERLLMLRLGVTDIRELYDNDIGWLRRRAEIASSENLSR